ncbi:MAG: signal recognition particle protein [Holophagales bacterium]|nr:signal recognition particle protein [Holophagales bacterium]
MFDGLQENLQGIFRRLKGEGTVTKEVLDSALREIRLALLEADVNIRVVRSFVKRLEERAIGEQVLVSLTPAQQVIKIVRDELVELLGDPGEELTNQGSPTIVMMCGLQGSGKTTTSGKLARRMKQDGRHPLLVAADLQRAAAVDQLMQVGSQVDVPVLTPESGENVLSLARRVTKHARELGHDLVIVDSAGRLHVDDQLMGELKQVAGILSPQEILFVADAMTGQDAVKSAQAFGEALELTGVVFTKMDGDSRGGAALSIRTVADVPIRYLGMGEKLDELDLFHPDRMASRILGMGDVLSLIEKAEEGLDKQETERLARRMVSKEFTLEDLRDQLRQIQRLGPLSQVLELMPKIGPLKALSGAQVDEKELKRVEAIINSMTPLERRKPKVLNGKRRKRIARGSGTRVQDVNRLLKQYQAMRKMMKGAQGKMLRRSLGGMMGGGPGVGPPMGI